MTGQTPDPAAAGQELLADIAASWEQPPHPADDPAAVGIFDGAEPRRRNGSSQRYAPAEPRLDAPRSVPYVDLDRIAADGIPPLDWLVEGWMVALDVVLLAGSAGCGKTTTAYALALALARGQDAFGLRVTRSCRVLVADEEQGVAESARTLIRLGAPHENLRLLSSAGVNLATEDGLKLLEAALEDWKPEFLVLDSATPILACVNENDAGEIGQRFGTLLRLRDRHGLTTLLIHHKPKDPAGGPQRAAIDRVRGSTVFTTQASTVWNLNPAGQDAVELVQAKRRGARLQPPLRITYAEDPNGRIILAGEAVDEDSAREQAADAILDLLTASSEMSTAGIVKTVPLAKGATAASHRKTVARALKDLIELGQIERKRRGVYQLRGEGSDAF